MSRVRKEDEKKRDPREISGEMGKGTGNSNQVRGDAKTTGARAEDLQQPGGTWEKVTGTGGNISRKARDRRKRRQSGAGSIGGKRRDNREKRQTAPTVRVLWRGSVGMTGRTLSDNDIGNVEKGRWLQRLASSSGK